MSFELVGVLVLSLVLGVVLFAYERLVRQVARFKREKSEEEKRARSEAMKLVKGARDKAVEIIGDAKVDATKWQQVLDGEMERLASEQLDDYKETLQKISMNIEQGVKSGSEDLKKVLEKEAAGVEKAVAERMKLDLAEVDKEIDSYKEKQMHLIEEKAGLVLEAVVKKVFTKAIKLSDHEGLIIQALEEAKKENAI